jgi:hypothetical protein
MGKDIGKALMDMTKRVKSEKLKKTMMLIQAGLSSGGELASLLEQTAENLRQQKFVEEKIRANVMMYVIFIFAAIAFGAPLLFGLSSFLVDILTNTLSTISIPDSGMASAIPISFNKVSLTTDFVLTYIYVSLATSALFGSLILGLINKGKEKYGLRFFPLLLVFSFSFFFIIRFAIRAMIGGMLGI